MIDQVNGLAQTRGTILVASASDSFLDILGHMIGRCGFSAAYCAEEESASMALSRAQPRLVVCDGHSPDGAVSRLITEVMARRIPLIVSPASSTPSDDSRVPVGARRLTFPLGHIAFGAMVDELLEPSRRPATDDGATAR